MAYRYLGESNTNSDGIATLPDGYTGTGAGVVDLVARTEVDSTFVSETYSILDTIFYDTGVDGTANTHWVNSRSNITHKVTSNYTELIDGNSSSFTICVVDPSNIGTMQGACVLNQNVCVEFDLIECGNGVSYRFYDYTSAGLVERGLDYTKQNITVKLEAKDNKVYLYYDGVLQANPPSFNPTNPFHFGLRVTPTASIKFKNLKVYPI